MSFDKLYQEFLDQDDPDFPTTQEVKMKWFYQQARRQGWEQGKAEAVEIADANRVEYPCDRWQSGHDAAAAEISRAIAAMEYGGEK